MDLAEVGSVGGFFALRTGELGGPAEPGAHARAYVPFAQIYAGDIAPLSARVDRVAAKLGAPERRIAASVAQLGLAARLWSIALGSAALHGEVPDLDPARLFWDPLGSSPDDLRLSGPRPLPVANGAAGASVDDLAVAVRDVVQHGHLVPLAAALRADGRISPGLLWGNAGSALAGAVRELGAWSRRAGRPEAGERADAIGAALLTHPDLRTTGVSWNGSFRRRSCCLYYRCPSGGLCGDCVFDRPPQRSSA
ncbi:(2Fe-2S)-binding protein [Streptomyces sp. IB2014 016-6]|uniref:(2Fe-2S)-binding protein n=1 Tax=Streptomyces sp. IB2014 016-6 TaxID=2517818 RepID=UPI0011CC60E4|nr:(2Fe-2S)-binding protein [Streptomyces sp. IB2014 016-6]TXL85711.1 ferric iron reductase [Streptomyces sp. IB2014 016-6]